MLTQLIGSYLAKHTAAGDKRVSGRRQRPKHLIPMERLEDRIAMACDAWIDLGNLGVLGDEYLRVEGDNAANTIEVWWDGVAYAVDIDCAARTEYFAAAAIPAGILIQAFGGDDRVTIDPSVTMGVTVEGGDGQDILRGGSGNDTLRGGNQNDRIYGNRGDDTLQGDAGDDMLDGGAGADVFDGGSGIDTADYSSRTDNLVIDLDNVADDGAVGERDNVRTSVENVWGGSGRDRITGSSGANELRGNGGNDVLDGSGGNDRLYGGHGDDLLHGGSGADLVYGEDGNDRLYGGSGNDYLWGGKGDDYLRGDGGTDRLFGEWGSDQLDGKDGLSDLLDGGPDKDTAQADAVDVVISCDP